MTVGNLLDTIELGYLKYVMVVVNEDCLDEKISVTIDAFNVNEILSQLSKWFNFKYDLKMDGAMVAEYVVKSFSCCDNYLMIKV